MTRVTKLLFCFVGQNLRAEQRENGDFANNNFER